ncbi:MAG: T9SS type A sorting domain-containing protein [Bacteroidetes bacterium]|nr:T9SS type A sorting domain-containing protein [Bacteroidota bacterium]
MKALCKFLLVLFFLPYFSFGQTIAAGGWHSLSVCNDNTVRAWGLNASGQLGNGTSGTPIPVPVQVTSLAGITSIAGGGYHSLALKNDSTVWTWGYNSYGELGNGTNTDSNVPVQVSSLTGITAIAGGMFHSFVLKNDSTVWAWGKNDVSQLGNGTNTDSNVPIQVSSLTGITAIAGGMFHSLVLKNDSTVWAWGYNAFGQLGNGNTNFVSNVPIPISSLTGIIAIAGGSSHSLALKNDGTIWAWGNNHDGQLGNGTNTDSNVPVPVSSLTDIIAIEGGAGHTLALKNDGTIWAWGLNLSGQLGNGTNTNSNIPVQINSLTGIIAVAGGSVHSLALKNDGTVWAWGDNDWGQLGNGTFGDTTDNNVPVQVVTGLCQIAQAVNAITEPLAILVYPNPTTGKANVQMSKLENVQIKIYDVLGEYIYQHIGTFSNLQIDLSSQPNGIYFLKMKTEQGIVNQKLIINK